MSGTQQFALELELEHDYQFTVNFDDSSIPSLTVDEGAPLGGDRGPNPARLLATAVGHCLGASLLYCLRRAHITVAGLRVAVEGTLVRNERGRMRIGSLRASLAPDVSADERERMGRCLDLFEDFCIVTESVRQGIPVTVDVAIEGTAPAVVAGV